MDICCHRDPRVPFEMQRSSAKSMAKAFCRSAGGSARLAESLLSRTNRPMAKDSELSVALEGRTGSLQKRLAVGLMCVGPVCSPMGPFDFRLLLLVAAVLYW